MADELELVNNTANLTYSRPFDRGYLTNWQSEHHVWRRVLGAEGKLKVGVRECFGGKGRVAPYVCEAS